MYKLLTGLNILFICDYRAMHFYVFNAAWGGGGGGGTP